MKKLFIKLTLSTIFLMSFESYSQITEGNWMLGGSGSFRTFNRENLETRNNSRYTFLEISPNVGYFLKDKFVIGAKPTFYYNPFEGAYNLGYGIGPFVKYYFLKPEKILNVFAESSYSFIENHNSNNVTYNKSSTRTFEIGAGTVIFFNNSVGLELGIKYKNSNINSLAIENGIQVNLGFQVHLEK